MTSTVDQSEYLVSFAHGGADLVVPLHVVHDKHPQVILLQCLWDTGTTDGIVIVKRVSFLRDT